MTISTRIATPIAALLALLLALPSHGQTSAQRTYAKYISESWQGQVSAGQAVKVDVNLSSNLAGDVIIQSVAARGHGVLLDRDRAHFELKSGRKKLSLFRRVGMAVAQSDGKGDYERVNAKLIGDTPILQALLTPDELVGFLSNTALLKTLKAERYSQAVNGKRCKSYVLAMGREEGGTLRGRLGFSAKMASNTPKGTESYKITYFLDATDRRLRRIVVEMRFLSKLQKKKEKEGDWGWEDHNPTAEHAVTPPGATPGSGGGGGGGGSRGKKDEEKTLVRAYAMVMTFHEPAPADQVELTVPEQVAKQLRW